MTAAFAQARALVQQLTTKEKLYLLNDITADLVRESAPEASTTRPAFPVIHGASWPEGSHNAERIITNNPDDFALFERIVIIVGVVRSWGLNKGA